MEILIAVAILGGLGLIFGLVLAAASKVFYVETDPRLEKLNDMRDNVEGIEAVYKIVFDPVLKKRDAKLAHRAADAEQDGDLENERKVIFDLYCTGIDGEYFIIEMQQLYQDFLLLFLYRNKIIQSYKNFYPRINTDSHRYFFDSK